MWLKRKVQCWKLKESIYKLRWLGFDFTQSMVPKRSSCHELFWASRLAPSPPASVACHWPGRCPPLFRARGAAQPGRHGPNSRRARSLAARLGSTQQPRQGQVAASAKVWDAVGLRVVVPRVRKIGGKMSSGHAPQRPLSDPKPTPWRRQPGGMGPEHGRASHAQRGP